MFYFHLKEQSKKKTQCILEAAKRKLSKIKIVPIFVRILL